MKKTIIIIGVLTGAGLLAYLYFKNKNKSLDNKLTDSNNKSDELITVTPTSSDTQDNFEQNTNQIVNSFDPKTVNGKSLSEATVILKNNGYKTLPRIINALTSFTSAELQRFYNENTKTCVTLTVISNKVRDVKIKENCTP